MNTEKKMEVKIKKMEKILFRGLHKEWVFHTLYEGGNITINNIRGDGIAIAVDHKDTIADIKNKLFTILQKPVGYLYSGSVLLENHQSLFHYLIPIGSTLSHVPVEGLVPELPTLQQRLEQHIDQFYQNEFTRKILKQKQYEQRYGLSSRFTL